MNKWFKNRRNQISILLLGVIVLLIFNFILPAYEKAPYYQRKINQQEKQIKILKTYQLHMHFHEQKYKEFKQMLPSLHEKIFHVRDTKALQQQLGLLQRTHHLRIVAQRIENLEMEYFFDEIIVRQQLKGKYQDHIRYLKALTAPKANLVTTDCRFNNLNPTETNPELMMTLEFKYLLPKL